ncbi:MAG: LPP20 family lipoprotein [Thiomicrorhabdus sp.]|nr:LPP20 family lipoprotein [Thiomicrorhabdus sp.]
MKKQTLLIAGITTSLALSGCVSIQTAESVAINPESTTVSAQSAPASMHHEVANNHQVAVKKPELLKITGIGYGAESTYAAYTAGQRRLMAIRSSKLDAYRALAEQLYGIKIDSNTSVSTLTAKNDSFRARVNAVVRGARVVSVTPMADHNYETVLEVYVDKRFFEEAFVYTASKTGAVEPDSAYKVSSY